MILNKINIITTENMTFETATNGGKRLIVIDIDMIPSEMKGKELELGTLRDDYKSMYPEYDFLFVNTSSSNTGGNLATLPYAI